MKLTLIGYGKMGKMIEKAALETGHEIVSIIDPGKFGNKMDAKSIEEADICIEFTNPHSVIDNIHQAISLKKPLVVGTTGWESELSRVRKIVTDNDASLFFSPNFSIGMNLFIKILAEAAKKILSTGLYEIAGIEEHHSKKLDAPSGTAKLISQAISEAVQNLSEVPFTSLRCGAIPGTHTIIFDSLPDTITMTHTARSREGFALGAVFAAEWLKGKTGFYTMDNLLFSGKNDATFDRPLYSSCHPLQ